MRFWKYDEACNSSRETLHLKIRSLTNMDFYTFRFLLSLSFDWQHNRDSVLQHFQTSPASSERPCASYLQLLFSMFRNGGETLCLLFDMWLTCLEAKSEAITHSAGVPNNFSRMIMMAMITKASDCSTWYKCWYERNRRENQERRLFINREARHTSFTSRNEWLSPCTAPCTWKYCSIASFEWSHTRVSSIDFKVRTTLNCTV